MEDSDNNPNEEKDDHLVADVGEGSGSSLGKEERIKLAEEFNVQRAKMKELFLQKEEELRIMSEQHQQLQWEAAGLRAQLQQLQTLSENQRCEIQSLQLLIHETVEASSSGSATVRQLQLKNLELEQQLNLVSKQQAAHQEAALAPAALVRSLARRLGAEPDPDDARKVTRYAQEDAEILRSLVEPLEEEIKALKEKLRSTDTQLQEATQNLKGAAKGDTKTEAPPCDMCRNYERQLVDEQARGEEARTRARQADLALSTAVKELEGVRTLQEETVSSWRAERAESAAELAELSAAVGAAQQRLEQRAADAGQFARQALDRLTRLTVQRETLQERLHTLQMDNDMLIGKYTKKALELQNEDINLPDTVEELQEHALCLREELITCQLGREAALEAEEALRTQMARHSARALDLSTALSQQQKDSQQLRAKLDQLETEREQMKELGDKLRQSNDRIEELLEDKRRLQNEVCELTGRISSLQLELDNSETVQQDFVRLSQSLQMELERIRKADTEVRWEHDEDVTECPACHLRFTHHKQKVHCRHCGRVFCGACTAHEVPTGPRRAPARVCAVCSTLLRPDAAPYFSRQPPAH